MTVYPSAVAYSDEHDHVETLAEPPDLAAALDAAPGARRYWDAFPRSTRRAILEWIINARTGPTRQARIHAPPATPPATSAPANGGSPKATPATQPGKHLEHATDRSVRQPHDRRLPADHAHPAIRAETIPSLSSLLTSGMPPGQQRYLAVHRPPRLQA